MDHGLDHKTRKYDFMAVDIRNIANRNGIYYFRCRIPSNLTNGQYREVKISLNTRCFDAHLFEIVEKANNYLRQVSLESLQKSGFNSEDIVFEIRNRVSQYIKNILIEQELFLIRQSECLNESKCTAEISHSTQSFDTPPVQANQEDDKFEILGDLVQAYLAIPHGSDAKYNADIVNSLNLLCEWFGRETDIRKLSRREMRNFRDNVLRKLPSNRKKAPALRNKSLSEHLSDTKHKKISVASVNAHLARLSVFFAWCVDVEYIVANPVTGMSIEKTSKASDEREVYSQDELKKIITSLLPKTLIAWAPYKFWIPLIMLYCGCRQNEACQLFVSDIVEVDGVVCFNFTENEETGARIKNSSSIRATPIHPVLLQIGFLEYVVQRIRKTGISDTRKIQLWPECTYDKMNGYARAFRRFFERFNRRYITQNPKRTCYSLRHNFIDNLKQSEIPENVVSEIAGHSNGNITYRRYGKTLKATVKLDAMKKLDFGFDIFELTGISPKTDDEISTAAIFVRERNSKDRYRVHKTVGL